MNQKRVVTGRRHYGTFRSKKTLQSTVTLARFPGLRIGDTADVIESAYEVRTYVWHQSQVTGVQLWIWDVLVNGGIIYAGSFGSEEGAYKSLVKTATLLDMALPDSSSTKSLFRRNPVIPPEWYHAGTPLRFELIGGLPIDTLSEVCRFKIYFNGPSGFDVMQRSVSAADLVKVTTGWAPVVAANRPTAINARCLVHAVANADGTTVGHWSHGEVIAQVPTVGVQGVTAFTVPTITKISDVGNSNMTMPTEDVPISLYGSSAETSGDRWYINFFRIIAG